ncbi:MAG TPA: DUF3090 family protein [Chloroflexota bacterium]|nr:DUF3090 family protein [Chloroflexota bacterium]
MDRSHLDLGWVDSAAVESFGEPGGRTFRILASTPSGSVSVWLEKYQVALLAPALEELLEKTPRGESIAQAGEPSLRGDLEVKAGSLALGYDGAANAFQLEASDLEESPMNIDSVQFRTGRESVERMLDQTRDILAASRPRCPLCGTPLTGEPHFCPESNGHSKTAQIEND